MDVANSGEGAGGGDEQGFTFGPTELTVLRDGQGKTSSGTERCSHLRTAGLASPASWRVLSTQTVTATTVRVRPSEGEGRGKEESTVPPRGPPTWEGLAQEESQEMSPEGTRNEESPRRAQSQGRKEDRSSPRCSARHGQCQTLLRDQERERLDNGLQVLYYCFQQHGGHRNPSKSHSAN